MEFTDYVELVASAVGLAGVSAIAVGAVIATALFVRRWRRKEGFMPAYRLYRQGLGRAILLGLEFLVAADIIRTVAISPTIRSVTVLAIVVAIRIVLSLALEVELQGRFPWQAAEQSEATPEAARRER